MCRLRAGRASEWFCAVSPSPAPRSVQSRELHAKPKSNFTLSLESSLSPLVPLSPTLLFCLASVRPSRERSPRRLSLARIKLSLALKSWAGGDECGRCCMGARVRALCECASCASSLFVSGASGGVNARSPVGRTSCFAFPRQEGERASGRTDERTKELAERRRLQTCESADGECWWRRASEWGDANAPTPTPPRTFSRVFAIAALLARFAGRISLGLGPKVAGQHERAFARARATNARARGAPLKSACLVRLFPRQPLLNPSEGRRRWCFA